ncbi:MAG: hypothetical protein ABI678_28815 [Kofleriaceae bacterium]
MGRTALYRDPVPFESARAKVQLEAEVLLVEMPDGWTRRHVLDGVTATIGDGFTIVQRSGGRVERRFVRMLMLERGGRHVAVITPPEHGTVAPNVVRVPEAPQDAAIVEGPTWEALAEWLATGGLLGALAIADLARLACIATPQFAAVVGEVAAQRALDLVWIATGPLRGMHDLDSALQPFVAAARHSTRAAEALVAAFAHAAGVMRRRARAR